MGAGHFIPKLLCLMFIIWGSFWLLNILNDQVSGQGLRSLSSNIFCLYLIRSFFHNLNLNLGEQSCMEWMHISLEGHNTIFYPSLSSHITFFKAFLIPLLNIKPSSCNNFHENLFLQTIFSQWYFLLLI